MLSKELALSGEEARKVAEAISSETIFKILQLLAKGKLDISTIAKMLKLSEAYISEEIKLLEKSQIVKVSYAPGKRGIRKICELAVEKIIIVIKP